MQVELQAGLNAMQITLSATQQTQLLNYINLLDKWNKTFSLTAVRERDKMLSHHVLDSLAVLPHLTGEYLLDVGSGGGTPGIPLAIARPDWQITLIDSNHKKTSFLQQAVIELGLKNVQVMCERVELYQPSHAFDWIVSRAFSDLSEFVRLTLAHLAENGHYAALKGVYPFEEIKQLPPTVQVQSVPKLHVPQLLAERHVVILERVQ